MSTPLLLVAYMLLGVDQQKGLGLDLDLLLLEYMELNQRVSSYLHGKRAGSTFASSTTGSIYGSTESTESTAGCSHGSLCYW